MIECQLPEMGNMKYSAEQALPNSNITVTCEEGYILTGGGDTLRCNAEGKFIDTFALCKCKLIYEVKL